MVRFDLDDFLRGNPLERAQVYEILNRIGAMSVEQIQREEDLIPNEGLICLWQLRLLTQ
jgi:hypothetical protein